MLIALQSLRTLTSIELGDYKSQSNSIRTLSRSIVNSLPSYVYYRVTYIYLLRYYKSSYTLIYQLLGFYNRVYYLLKIYNAPLISILYLRVIISRISSYRRRRETKISKGLQKMSNYSPHEKQATSSFRDLEDCLGY